MRLLRLPREPEAPVAFEDWARARQGALRRTAYLLCGDWDAAQDLVQETLTRLYRAWDRLEDTGSVEGYARRTLTNVFLDGRRRRSSTEVVSDVLPERAAVAGPDVELRLTLLRALAAMPPSQRAVLVLRYWEDLSTAQAAEVLGCSEGNVKSQAARGLVALRAELARQGVDLVADPSDAGDDDGPSGLAGVTRLPGRGRDRDAGSADVVLVVAALRRLLGTVLVPAGVVA